MNRMNHYSAIVLASIGWYLMVPPNLIDKSTPVSDIPPLGQWQIIHSFDTANACESGSAGMIKGLNEDAAKDPPDAKIARQREWMSDAECIASDDPRLKTKLSRSRLKFRQSSPN